MRSSSLSLLRPLKVKVKLTQVNITSLNKSLNNKYFIDISAKTKRRNKHGDVNYVSHMLIGPIS